MTSVGVIIIGRNEGPRLATCLRSVARAGAEKASLVRIVEVVYVDSDSSDGSAELAASMGATVVKLDPSIPFTAARARNGGAELLLRHHGGAEGAAEEVEFLQFLDGDTELHPRWIAHAVDYLHHHPHVAVACGRRRERFPEASVYNLLADMEWDTPIGPAGEFGGDCLIRAAAFVHLGGYNEHFIAGEEPDLAARLRLDAGMGMAGPRIVRLNHEMTLHDLAMTRFSQWWRRTRRSGHALAQLAHTHGKAPLYFYRQQWRSTLFWTVVVPLGLAAMAIVLSPWALPLLPIAYAYLGVRIFLYRRRRGDDRDSASAYACYTMIGKFPQLLGMLTYYRNLWTRRTSTLIEYKAAPANPAPAAVGST
jgi:GT2 family glycosyltransferase